MWNKVLIAFIITMSSFYIGVFLSMKCNFELTMKNIKYLVLLVVAALFVLFTLGILTLTAKMLQKFKKK